MSFVHLHTHSDFSILDGMSQVDELIRVAKKLGQPAIAITDHGSTSGLYAAQKAGEKHGIKVILGTEFYIEREDGKNGHLIVLAKNNTGLKNIFKMQKLAYVDNFYYKPRINFDILKDHSEGLIVSSACLANEINQHIMKGDIISAKKIILHFKKIFKENFYLELQSNTIPEQTIVNKTLVRFAKEMNIDLILTNDVHYTYKDDWYAHEVLLALQFNKKMDDDNRFKFPTHDFWLKSKKEMTDGVSYLDKDVVEKACANTVKIAEMCNSRIEAGHFLPEYYNIPEGETSRSLLVKRIKEGIKEKNIKMSPTFKAELQNEIDIIDRNGYCGYFLIVQDYVKTARKNKVLVGDGRGSGAGSKVAYITDITRINPDEYGLLFERFMADGRTPDFDVDFSDQDAVFTDLQAKYGKHNVSRIAAFGTMSPRNVTRKVLNAFGAPQYILKRITSEINETCETLEEAYKNPNFLAYKKQYPEEFKIIERLEGCISHLSTHAGGVLTYPNLSEYLPVITTSEDRDKLIAGFDKKMLEELGHFKFDILGLITLPQIKLCLDFIKENYGIDLNLYEQNYDDPNIYKMLCEGDTSGIFQLNNQSAKLMEQKPKNFKDLIAINALIRPGIGDWNEYIARRNGKKYEILPEREEYMRETEGIITYQEQFLLDCKTFAGWGIAFADKHVRKNKHITEDEELLHKFLIDCEANGHDSTTMFTLWKEIEESVDGGYSFNKSHSASYAVMSFHTAFLKYYYPKEFYASLMTIHGDSQASIAQYINECKQKGITMLPPDINKSNNIFIPTENGILFRITTLKDVGASALSNLYSLRPIKSLADLYKRRTPSKIRSNVIESLIKAGTFDFENPDRTEMLWKLSMMKRKPAEIKRKHICPKPKAESTSNMEKEVLGMYFTNHPCDKYAFSDYRDLPNNARCIVGGIINEVAEIIDKNNNKMAFISLDRSFGITKLIIFSSDWKKEKNKELLIKNNTVLVHGRKSGNDILFDSVSLL